MKYKLLLLLFFIATVSLAQSTGIAYRNHLSKRITLTISQQPVRSVLQEISNAGNFYFSYNSRLIDQDSLVSLSVSSMPLREVLDRLFKGRVDYKEIEEYVILRYAVNHLTIEPENITTDQNFYQISGFIKDIQTGKPVKQASVYEKRLLQSTLTDEAGFFTLRFKGEHREVILTAGKETYRDTAMIFLSDVRIAPSVYADPDREKGSRLTGIISGLGIGRFLLSSKQRIQDLNIPDFLANTPFQASFLPGLSSHGMMSSRIVNKVSINVLGGYTAGVNGVEIGGLFNLSIGNVKSFQAAGLFNMVGGSVEGAQFAGLFNYDHQYVKAFQAAGIINLLNANLDGLQAAGVANVVNGKTGGTQIAGAANFAAKKIEGFQLSGIANVAAQRIQGGQIAALFNYAKNVEGIQVGLINFSDTLSGIAIGLLNFSNTGYKRFNFFSNELVHANVAIKTGNASLYSLLFVGKRYVKNEKIETFGLGFGHDFMLTKSFSFGTELTGQQLYLGNWDYANLLFRLQGNAQVTLFKGINLFAGPAYSYYSSQAPAGSSAPGYKQDVSPARYHQFSRNTRGWWGWNAGISIF